MAYCACYREYNKIANIKIENKIFVFNIVDANNMLINRTRDILIKLGFFSCWLHYK